MTDVFEKPHPDSEAVDEIKMKMVPRFKTSDMSGDEWRVSCLIEFFRKGKKVYERSFHSIENAAKFLPWVLDVEMIEGQDAPSPGLFSADLKECFQTGCSEPSTNVYRLKQIYSDDGDGPLPDNGFEHRRAFCQKHSHRGNSDMEDSDANYELVEGTGEKVIAPEDVSPSAFGGTIDCT